MLLHEALLNRVLSATGIILSQLAQIISRKALKNVISLSRKKDCAITVSDLTQSVDAIRRKGVTSAAVIITPLFTPEEMHLINNLPTWHRTNLQ